MKELLEKIYSEWDAFAKDADALVTKGNKSAGQRARKTSLNIAALLKEFRAVSIEESKK
ncbi:histone H1 [Coprobacter tertius]|uniref:Histone H1 n=1 Tax=Coprobacter tertius TaxID=2944915 RepID=A0ABT1MEH6_9BACT|nr:histone H1 [Coprobacter tertius]MCP9610769.1 histone H1 [Coprobacter tertius]